MVFWITVHRITKGGTTSHTNHGNKAVWANYARDLLYYSGKRKKHTVKNLYSANQKGLIIYKTTHRQTGRKHDYNVYKKNHPELPKDVVNMFDLGFLGVEEDFPQQLSSLPFKKEKDCELTRSLA